MEVSGIEPLSPACKAEILPLNYTPGGPGQIRGQVGPNLDHAKRYEKHIVKFLIGIRRFRGFYVGGGVSDAC
jgi:hypothetical protein